MIKNYPVSVSLEFEVGMIMQIRFLPAVTAKIAESVYVLIYMHALRV